MGHEQVCPSRTATAPLDPRTDARRRYNRPGWATGLFIAAACVASGVAGLMMFKEGKKVKRVEGVPAKVMEDIQDIEKKAGLHPTA